MSESAFSALLAESVEEAYEHAPCGYLSTLPDGRIVKANKTLLEWLGQESLHQRTFSDLLTVGGKIYYETHISPLLRMQGEVNSLALDLVARDGSRLPVLASIASKAGPDGRPALVRVTLFDATERRSYERELLRARKEAENTSERLTRVLSTLQRSLLPPSLPQVPGLEADAYYHTASIDDLGGDFYDLFPLADGRWAFFIGDVCGKGPDAATVTSLTRYTLRAAAIHDPDPGSALATLNTALCQEWKIGEELSTCTAIFGVLEPRDGAFAVTFASGGHPPPLLLSGSTADHVPCQGGPMIGFLPEARFPTDDLLLKAGDTLLLYTDGLTDARTSAKGPRYGDEALRTFAAELAPASAAAAITALTDLLNGFDEGLEDDTAILALGIPA
ncbi:SpoIIE family protein phosphatase [Spirillospora sp. NPDC048911]|uniref:SpoIIE family protein phosphatase n=1 Tax=Spirillospora sp. NPDC048911 TaxID=3364527 RepID=UPI003712FA91